MNRVLECHHLSRTFGRSTMLSDLGLSLCAGQRLAVIGSSGSGKTTLLRLIAGLDVPSSGEVRLLDQPASAAGQLILPPERRGVAMVFQGLALLPQLRALDQIAFAAPGREGRKRAEQLLERVGLAHRATAPLDQLSGGERQRIALARALAQRPAILLMDEPFASLDDLRRPEMRQLLRSLLDETGTTLVLVTHARDDVLDLAERVMVLANGRCVAADSLNGLLADPRHVAAARCMALGTILRGQVLNGLAARTDFGDVALLRESRGGETSLLVRPGQPSLIPGNNADLVALEWRPPEIDSEPQQIAVVRRGESVIRVRTDRRDLRVGDRVGVQINGPVLPLADQ